MGWVRETFAVLGDFLGEVARGGGGAGEAGYGVNQGIGGSADDDEYKAWGGGPTVNIDGSPMVNDVDIYGNTFGVTEDSFDFGGCDSGSSFD